MASESIEQAVRELAYAKWEEAGRPNGDGVCFWLEAERAVGQESNQASQSPAICGIRSETSPTSGAINLTKTATGSRRRAS